MVLTRSAHTATIIAFPGTLAKDIDQDTEGDRKADMRPAFYDAFRGSEACL
jgi:hypothetical protein